MKKWESGHDVNNSESWCWQEKKVLRALRKHHSGTTLVKLRALYQTLTEIDSDFNDRKIEYFIPTIQTYSGLPKAWIGEGLNILEELKVISCSRTRDSKGVIGGRLVIFHEGDVIFPDKDSKVSTRVLSGSGSTSAGSSGSGSTSAGSSGSGSTSAGYRTPLEEVINKNKIPREEVNKKISSFSDIIDSEDKSTDHKLKLSEKEYDIFIPVLRYWNSLDNLTNHKLPVNKKDSVSKTIKYAVKLMKDISGGRFFKRNDVDCVNVPVPLQTTRISLDQIKHQMDKLNNAWDSEYEPISKKYLPRTLDKFLYDSYTNNRSYFYETYELPLIKIGEVVPSDEELDIPVKVIESYLRIMNNPNRSVLISKIVDMKEWYESVDRRMGLIYKHGTKYEAYLGSFQAFVDRHIEHLSGYTYEINPGYLKLKGKAWGIFMDWIKKEYELDLMPTQEKRKMMLARRKRNMIKYFDYKSTDFIGEGPYTQEELDLVASGKYQR